jgi:hypothetical protein
MADAIKLNASTEDELAEALEGLKPKEEGWITLGEAQWLFSAAEEGDVTALSEFDEEGLRAMGSFAADCGCSPRRVDGDKIFFTKNA